MLCVGGWGGGWGALVSMTGLGCWLSWHWAKRDGGVSWVGGGGVFSVFLTHRIANEKKH